MNYLEIDPEDRPMLETRERITGAIEVKCPACGHWRQGFLIEPLDEEDATARGVDWACDGDRARWAAEAAEAAGPPLELVKQRAKETVQVARDIRMNGGAPCTIGTIDSDERSRLYVAGAVNMAQIAKAASDPFTIRWRLADNSYVDLDADAMIATGLEVGRFVDACCQVGFNLKDDIDAAADAIEVAAIDIAGAFNAITIE